MGTALARLTALGTFLHQFICGGDKLARPFVCQLNRIDRRMSTVLVAFAIERQRHSDARALAQPAADIDVAVVQFPQALADRHPEAGAFLLAVLASAPPESGFAQALHFVDATHYPAVFDPDPNFRTPRAAPPASLSASSL